MAAEVYDVFVSYARADWRHAADIDSTLRARGLKTFFDRRNLPLGVPWVRALEEAISISKSVVVLIGRHGFGNTQQYERDLAFFRQTRDPTLPVVPVILPEATLDRPFNFLQVLTWVDFSHVARVSDAPELLEHLVAAVRREVSEDAALEAICPYRGLDAFREEDSAFFFGRGAADEPLSAIGQLGRKVRAHPFVVVVGRSGSGKSSLVYAGLLPALRRERDRFWNVLALRPGPEPLRSLAAVFNPRAENEGEAGYAAKIGNEADKLRNGDPALLSHMIRQGLDRTEGKPDRLLLYVDQWEELYARAPSLYVDKVRFGQHAADVNRFIELLLTASQSGPVSIVATVRADFYDPLIGHEKIRSLLPAQQMLVGAMSRSDLERTIVEPAKKLGLAFEPAGLVGRILDEAGEDEGMLPLLQYALKETWAHRQGSVITADSYAQSGGVREAIRITAERTFDDLSPADQQAARRLFLRLVTPGEGQEDTRARAAMPAEPVLRKIVEQFANPRTRLLVTGFDRAARPTVEVAHEALIRTWPRLRAWIEANRDKLRSRAAILQAKAEWEQNGWRQDLLLPPGFQLERARALLADPGDLATDDIRDFVELSSACQLALEEAERRQREAALAQEEASVAEIKGAQERTTRLQAEVEDAQRRTAHQQRIASRAIMALIAMILITGVVVVMQQWTNAEQLALRESGLREQARQLEASELTLLRERGINRARQFELEHVQANILAELSSAAQRRGEFDSALRLALQATRVDRKLLSERMIVSRAAAVLVGTIIRANWNLSIGYSGPATFASFSPDGSRIVTASEDRTARIWDAASGKEIAVLRGHDRFVTSAAFDPDGSRIVTASSDNTARIWDAASAQEIAVLRGHDGYTSSAAFSPDGRRIVTASWDQTARVWDAASGNEITVLRGHDGTVLSAAFSPDGKRVVTASWDQTARLWDSANGKEIAVLRGHHGSVASAAFSPDGSRIVTASWDQTARVWDAAGGKEITVLRGHDGNLGSAVFGPDGSRIVTASWDQTARLWDAANGKEIAVLRGHEGTVFSAAFSPDGSRIVTASSDNTTRLWDSAGDKEITVLRGHDGTVTSAAFSPDRSRIVTASQDATARIWDTGSGKEIKVMRSHQRSVTSAAFSPDGSRIVMASEDNTARIWDVASGKEIAVLHGHDDTVTSATFSPDGSRIVTTSWDKTARIWDSGSIKEFAALRDRAGFDDFAVFSPDGLRIVTASGDSTTRIWDATSGKEIAVLRGRDRLVSSAAFSPGGSRIVTASDDYNVRIWDVANGMEIAILRGHERNVTSAAFSPDGSRIVTASEDNTARIWDAANGREIAVLRGHDGGVSSAAFSPDGSRIVTASEDNTARIWDGASGEEIAVLRGHDGGVTSAAFSRDGSRIATASRDQTVRIWDSRFFMLDADGLILEACRRLAGVSKFTRDEMRLAGYENAMVEVDVCNERP